MNTRYPSHDSPSAQDPAAVTKRFDPGDTESPTEGVIDAVATALETDPTRLPPLFEVLDPEAMDQLLSPSPQGTARPANGRLCFRYAGCEVAVHADGRAVARPID